VCVLEKIKVKVMKGLMTIIGMVGISSMMLVSCVVHDHNGRRPMPPGQAKKIYGGGAKDYAPGQVKKRGYH
jgi:hypothetical protein